MSETREVTSCLDCPLANYSKMDDDYTICGDESRDIPWQLRKARPVWCPLDNGPITIQLAESSKRRPA